MGGFSFGGGRSKAVLISGIRVLEVRGIKLLGKICYKYATQDFKNQAR